MINEKRVLAVIPARGGSKGLIDKNSRLCCGKPLIAWTIEAARNSRYIDATIVSTDSETIAALVKKQGIDVPFLRPQELATDDSKVIDVVLHAIHWHGKKNDVYDIVVLLQPTSPCRYAHDIDCALELLCEKNAQGIISVCAIEHHPYLINVIPEDGNMKDFLQEKDKNKNRQDYGSFYKINGALYLGYCAYVERIKNFCGDETYAYIMPKERSVDIDDEYDLSIAEMVLQKRGL